MAARKGAAMKSQNTTPKLISKREFNRRKVALQEKHAWLIKDDSFDIRPGWIHLFDNTLTKIKSSLNEEDIEESRLLFLYIRALALNSKSLLRE